MGGHAKGNKMGCFESSRNLLLKVERVVAETAIIDAPERVSTVMHRFLFGPVAFLKVGLRVIFVPVALWSVLTMALWLLLLALGHSQPSAKNAAFAVAALLAGGFVTYMLPSGCASAGIKLSHVKAAKDAIVTVASCSGVMQQLRDTVDVMKARCEARVKRLSWALGIAWAALLWAFANMVLRSDLAATERNRNEVRPGFWKFSQNGQ
jgi:hypothetical protein